MNKKFPCVIESVFERIVSNILKLYLHPASCLLASVRGSLGTSLAPSQTKAGNSVSLQHAIQAMLAMMAMSAFTKYGAICDNRHKSNEGFTWPVTGLLRSLK